ncbi:MAG TPA: glycosyltransferase family 4 protein, partial [Acidimicrobiales bacterium]|nr:glycosyltransferase family 4 protein [Acidimicrobiales bacterium]
SFQFSSPGLFHHLARYGGSYDFVVFSPYLFWSTAACMPVVAERAVVAPCLHDEAYARVPVLAPVFESAHRLWFLSEPEHQLAHKMWALAPHSVTGAGVKVPAGYDVDGFRARHRLEKPFVLFAGRREEGKGASWLGPALRCLPDGWELVTIGKSDKEPLPGTRDLGYLTTSERDNAFAAAGAYLQPSAMESFSRTVMESWLAGTPVVAFEGSEVVAWHVRRSGGGVLFSTENSLGDALARVSAEMGDAGRRYVLDNYTWPAVLDRMEASLS